MTSFEAAVAAEASPILDTVEEEDSIVVAVVVQEDSTEQVVEAIDSKYYPIVDSDSSSTG